MTAMDFILNAAMHAVVFIGNAIVAGIIAAVVVGGAFLVADMW